MESPARSSPATAPKRAVAVVTGVRLTRINHGVRSSVVYPLQNEQTTLRVYLIQQPTFKTTCTLKARYIWYTTPRASVGIVRSEYYRKKIRFESEDIGHNTIAPQFYYCACHPLTMCSVFASMLIAHQHSRNKSSSLEQLRK